MARPARPGADPVTINPAKTRIRYWKSGWVGAGQRSEKSCTPETADQIAAALRAELYAKRIEDPTETTDEVTGRPLPSPTSTVQQSYLAWITELEAGKTGTLRAYRSVMNKWMRHIGGNLVSEMDITLWRIPLKAAADSTPMSVNRFKGIETAMRSWRKWAHQTGWLPRHCLATDAELRGCFEDLNRLVKGKNADAAADPSNVDDDDDGDNDKGVQLDQVPPPAAVQSLAEAIYRRETRTGTTVTERGGARSLGHYDAWRVSQSPVAASATGMRMCELLGFHTKDLNRETGVIRVRRQLDRYKPWIGQTPPTRAVKSGKTRRTQCWDWYLPTLLELADYADEHLGGWIFAPTRGQRDWAKAWSDAIGRGITLLNEEAGEDGPVWIWKQHYLRHHFGSWSLAPESVGGYEVPLATVTDWLGHGSSDVTTRIYHHGVGDEVTYARQATGRRPGETAKAEEAE